MSNQLFYLLKKSEKVAQSVGPLQSKNDPKIKWKSNVRIERNKENESCSTTWVDLKTVVVPYSNPEISPLGHQKVKNDPKIKSKSNVRI